MADRHECQIHGEERQVAPEREQPQLGVTVDVSLSDLDESSAECQQL